MSMDITDEQWAQLARVNHNSCGLDGKRLKAVFDRLADRLNDDDYDTILGVFNTLLGTHGVEVVAHPDPSTSAELIYCNAGDTYAATLAYDSGEGEFIITSWGAWMEAAEQAHAEENNVTRCFYCGDWYDDDGEPCHDEDGTARVYGVRDEEEDEESEQNERERLTEEGIDAAEQWRWEQEGV